MQGKRELHNTSVRFSKAIGTGTHVLWSVFTRDRSDIG